MTRSSLYVLNRARQLAQVVPLPGISPGQGRLPKHEKPDIEAAFAYSSAGETHVIAFGSGSSGTVRDGGLHVRIDARRTIRIDELALGALYNNLRQAPEIGSRRVLNIEGAALTDDHAIFAQRAAGSSGNYLIRFERAAFINWLGNNTPPPAAEFFPVRLVSVSGVEAGFTGLAFSPVHRRLFFTAAVEDRNDPVQDGVVLGSFVGSFSWPAQQQPILENCEAPENLPASRKLESLCLLQESPAGCKLLPLPTMIWALHIWLILASRSRRSERPTTAALRGLRLISSAGSPVLSCGRTGRFHLNFSEFECQLTNCLSSGRIPVWSRYPCSSVSGRS